MLKRLFKDKRGFIDFDDVNPIHIGLALFGGVVTLGLLKFWSKNMEISMLMWIAAPILAVIVGFIYVRWKFGD